MTQCPLAFLFYRFFFCLSFHFVFPCSLLFFIVFYYFYLMYQFLYQLLNIYPNSFCDFQAEQEYRITNCSLSIIKLFFFLYSRKWPEAKKRIMTPSTLNGSTFVLFSFSVLFIFSLDFLVFPFCDELLYSLKLTFSSFFHTLSCALKFYIKKR